MSTDHKGKIIHNMSQTKFNELLESNGGKLPAEFANSIIHTRAEDVNLNQMRTEVIYDNRSSDKHWGYKTGIPSGTTITGKDFSKYSKLIIHTYQASTIGGVKGACEIDLDRPSLQWDGSEQTYYAGSNVYYCTYVDDGSDDYVQSRTCMALVNSTKTSITVYSTKTGKYHQQANDGKIFMIEGVLKTPVMVYTGAELHEGNGVSIKDGVIGVDENVFGVPSNNNFISISITSGTEKQYTAPTNGYLTIGASPSSTGIARVTLLNSFNFGAYNSSNFKLGVGQTMRDNTSMSVFATCPCKKGDNIRILTTNVTTIYCHFVPSEV